MAQTGKGKKILKAMTKTYGSKAEAKRIFVAMIVEKKLTGVELPNKRKK